MKSWETKREEMIHENPFFQIWKRDFVTPDGVEGQWFYHTNNNAIAVIVQSSEDGFVFLREYRYLQDRTSLSCVAGAVDPGETVEQAAKRECIEEVGYEIGTLIHVGTNVTAPAFSTEQVSVFLARDLKKVEEHRTEYEYIETVILSRKEIDEAILKGEIWDSNAIAEWQLVKLYLDSEK